MLDSFAYVWCVLGEPFDEAKALTGLDAVFLRTLGIEPGGRPEAGQTALTVSRPPR